MLGLQNTQNGNLEPGKCLLGKYKVLAKLGQGGFGAVYRCLDAIGGIQVAVKTIPMELLNDPADMKEMRANFQLTATLIHQNIAACLNLEEDAASGNYYMVMELVQGKELRQWIRKKHKTGGLTLAEAIPILQQVASALDYAHAMAVMHRDIKPGNIMVKSDGVVKVLDFGLAAHLNSSCSSASKVFCGRSGTSMYMAPEQWQGLPQGAATDQYALAVTAYEMLAGHLPFESTDMTVMFNMVLNVEPAPIPKMPKQVNEALARGLAKKPADRFKSCQEFVSALAEGLEAENGGACGLRMAPLAILLVMLALFFSAFGYWWNAHSQGKNIFAKVFSRETRLDEVSEEPHLEAVESLEAEQAVLTGEGPVVIPPASDEDYLVVDLNTGSHSYFKDAPNVEDDRCRTGELWLRRIPKGTFTMGPFGTSNWARARQRKVTLSQDFYIGVFEVTQRQWSFVVGDNPSFFKSDLRPVEQVSYSDICEGEDSFLERLKARSGLEFDLPTEAQWEYACRAGVSADQDKLDEIIFGYSKVQEEYNCPELDEIAWYAGNAEVEYELSYGKSVFISGREIGQDILGGTHFVGKKKANAWNIYDMYGNVSEWCKDFFELELGTNAVMDPEGPKASADGRRAVRGTSYGSNARQSRASVRGPQDPTLRTWFLGFRVVFLPRGEKQTSRL